MTRIVTDGFRNHIDVDEIHQLHAEFTLAGEPRNSLLGVSDDLLRYLVCLLRDESPEPLHAPETHWNTLLLQLSSHWITPLLYLKIAHLSQELQPPEAVTHALRLAFLSNRAKTTHADQQLGEVLNTFTQEGIHTLVLKGTAIGSTVYPDPAARLASDIDLLVRPEQFRDAASILTDSGYQSITPRFGILKDLQFEEFFQPVNTSPHYRPIELHWDLHIAFGRRLAKLDDLFQRRVEVNTPLVTFQTLNPVDTLIFEALHSLLSHSRDIQLKWIVDTALLARNLKVPEDWETLQQRSVESGARTAVEHMLNFARAWTGLELPEGFQDFSTWPAPSDQEQRSLMNALRKPGRPDVMLKMYLAHAPSSSQKVRLLLKLIFPDREYIRETFSSSHNRLLFLSYFRYWQSWVNKALAQIRGTNR